jgi:hypothetical protein
MDQFNGNVLIADRKIAKRSFRLRTPKCFVTDVDRTKDCRARCGTIGSLGLPGLFMEIMIIHDDVEA